MRSGESAPFEIWEQRAEIPIGAAILEGELKIPREAVGLALFAHGSGSGRHSPRNQFVASVIREAGIGTLLFDLLTLEEESVDRYTGRLRFDINLLAERLVSATNWVEQERGMIKSRIGVPRLPIADFGPIAGAAAALVAAATLGDAVGAVVSRGGRPDLAGDALSMVSAPTLLIVGGHDGQVVELNEHAFEKLRCEKKLRIIPGAT